MLMKEKEIDHIQSIGDLRAALADIPDDMPICDQMGEDLCLFLTTGPLDDKTCVIYS
jgi:hypothetical protein